MSPAKKVIRLKSRLKKSIVDNFLIHSLPMLLNDLATILNNTIYITNLN